MDLSIKLKLICVDTKSISYRPNIWLFKYPIIALIFQKEAFTIAQKKYEEGIITNYEFLESKSKYIITESELISSKYDYLFKIKVLEYYKM